MENKYELHFKQGGWPIIFSDLVFKQNSYGQFDYYLIQEGDKFSGYLSEKGLKQTYKFGQQLLDEKFAFEVVEKLEKLHSELKSGRFEREFEKEKNNVKKWKIIERYMDKLCELYLYCEHPVLSAIEEEIEKACPNKKDLPEVLHKPELAKSLGFSKEQERLLKLLIQLGKLKFDIHVEYSSLFDKAQEFLVDLAKKNKLSVEQVGAMRNTELYDLMKNGKFVNESILDMRLKGSILFNFKGNLFLVTGKEYLAWKKKTEGESKEIRGTVAYAGKATGRVKIHLSITKGQEIAKGAVLVTGMTNPQIVPFLKNAVAIVTDEGGLTCHAAIVSRELKKPCIVGTKNATRILEDGDLVEVDANKGIVRILEKAN